MVGTAHETGLQGLKLVYLPNGIIKSLTTPILYVKQGRTALGVY